MWSEAEGVTTRERERGRSAASGAADSRGGYTTHLRPWGGDTEPSMRLIPVHNTLGVLQERSARTARRAVPGGGSVRFVCACV